jgi:5'-nucleotidase
LCNDDGIDAIGLTVLEAALREIGPLFVAAPSSERSAQSHALTMHKPVHASARGEGRWAISGTPADCVYLALHGLLEHAPSLVVSGINRGANLGYDVHYSGTVAGAREAALHGLPGLSVSLHTAEISDRLHWETAAHFAIRLARQVLRDGLPKGVHLNLNVPNRAIADVRGLKTTRIGHRRYRHEVDSRTDPRGRTYYWIGGPPEQLDGAHDEDGPAVDAGWAAVTPLSIRPTHTASLEHVRAWTDA